ncbi:MAG: glycosyltransferase family 39 protein [Bacteroidia bacterium]
MIARNFYEIDSNILYPRTDSAGELSGIVGVEFPVFNYLIFLISLIFGFENWYGRLINLIITSIGTFYFYKLIRNYFGESSAFFSAITLLVSMWFSYSRITIPDVFAASLCIISLYHGFQYLENGKPFNLFIFLY